MDSAAVMQSTATRLTAVWMLCGRVLHAILGGNAIDMTRPGGNANPPAGGSHEGCSCGDYCNTYLENLAAAVGPPAAARLFVW